MRPPPYVKSRVPRAPRQRADRVRTLASYVYNASEAAQKPDERPGAYYVSVQDSGRTTLLCGPWPTHREALDMVEPVRSKACELDPRGHFYAYGTARKPDDDSVPIRAGSLNKYFGL